MSNFFDPNSPLGTAFNDIFGQATPATPSKPAPINTTDIPSPDAKA